MDDDGSASRRIIQIRAKKTRGAAVFSSYMLISSRQNFVIPKQSMGPFLFA